MLSIPEYREENGNVYLILRNKISGHSKTIHSKVMEEIENNWGDYNDTQINILQCLFLKHQATLAEFVQFAGVNDRTVRRYVNEFIEKDVLEKLSEKQRDINAVYVFKKR